jgi:hypothetical protein
MKTMFGKAKHKYLADIISIRSLPEAQVSVQKLEQEFATADSQEKRLAIIRAAGLAGNRALASAKRRRVSRRERAELRQVADIYGQATIQMYEQYRGNGGGGYRGARLSPPVPRISSLPLRLTPRMKRLS